MGPGRQRPTLTTAQQRHHAGHAQVKPYYSLILWVVHVHRVCEPRATAWPARPTARICSAQRGHLMGHLYTRSAHHRRHHPPTHPRHSARIKLPHAARHARLAPPAPSPSPAVAPPCWHARHGVRGVAQLWHSSGADDLVGEEGPRAEWPSCLRLQWRLGRRAEAGAERERACGVRLVRVLVYVQCTCTCAVHAQCPCSALAIHAQGKCRASAGRTGDHQLGEQRGHAHHVLLASSHVLRPGRPALITSPGRREHTGGGW